MFRRITVPQIAPGLAAGALFAFMISFDNFPISLWLADAQHNPVPLLVFQMIANVFEPSVAAISTLMILFAMVVADPWSGSAACSARWRCTHRHFSQGGSHEQNRRDAAQSWAAQHSRAPLIIGRRAAAAERSITVGIYTAQQGEVVRKQIIPPFEAEHKCKVYTTQGVTLEQIALMRATRNNPKYSVMFIDDIGVELAKNEGLIEKLPARPDPEHGARAEAVHLQRRLRRGVRDVRGGAVYNSATGKPLASYGDLWDRACAGAS